MTGSLRFGSLEDLETHHGHLIPLMRSLLGPQDARLCLAPFFCHLDIALLLPVVLQREFVLKREAAAAALPQGYHDVPDIVDKSTMSVTKGQQGNIIWAKAFWCVPGTTNQAQMITVRAGLQPSIPLAMLIRAARQKRSSAGWQVCAMGEQGTLAVWFRRSR